MNTTIRLLARRFLLLALVPGMWGLAGCNTSPAKSDTNAGAIGTYSFWPTFPDDPHVQFVRAINNSDDVAPKQASGLEKLVFGKELDKGAVVNKPYGVAMVDGRIYVADIRNNCVEELDLRKKETLLIGVSGLNQLKRPVAVAVADDSTLYVADLGRGAIMVYDASGRYSRAFGHPGFKPSSLAVHRDRLYATDMAGQKVDVYDRNDGKLLLSFGTVGDGDGQFRLPIGVATDKKGDVYVVDMARCRLQKFSPEGKFIGAVGAMGKVAGTFARPKHVAVDSDGVVYVVDAAFQNVQMFDDKFEMLMHFGAAGDYPGAMNLPAGICVSDDSLDLFTSGVHPGFKPKHVVVVTNQFGGDRVAIYVVGDLRNGYTAADLAKAAAPVTPGTSKSTAEDVKMSAPGTEEPVLPPTALPPPSAQPQTPKNPDPPSKETEPK